LRVSAKGIHILSRNHARSGPKVLHKHLESFSRRTEGQKDRPAVNSNLAWLVIFLNLLALGAGLTYVALKPAEVKAVLVVLAEEAREQNKNQGASRSAPRSSPGEVAQASPRGNSPTPDRPPTQPEGAPTPAAGAPPPRSAVTAASENQLRPTIEAEFMGPSTSPVRGEQPSPHLYPFRPVRRTFPDDEHVDVEFLIGNFSGRIWNPAEVVLKAPGYPQAQVFRLENWRLDEIASLKYRFPKAELERRVGLLRVVEVRGTQRQSARGEQVAMDREALMQNFTEQVGADQGLMRLFAGAMGAQVPAPNSAPEQGTVTTPVLKNDKLEVFLPGTPVLSSNPTSTLELSTEARGEIASKWNEVMNAARTISARCEEIAVRVGTEGYEVTMREGGKEALLEIMAAKAKYDETGLDLALAVGRSNDPAVKELQAPLDAVSTEILNVMTALQTQLQTLDRTFTLGVNTP
jgi:hypothetical protein